MGDAQFYVTTTHIMKPRWGMGHILRLRYLIYPVEEAAVGVGCHHVDPVDVHDGMTEVASVQRS